MSKEITHQHIQTYKDELATIPQATSLQHAIMNQGINAVCENPNIKSKLNRVFSVEIDTDKVSAQEKSGRCWLFATLNTLRHDFEKEYNIKDFEFSHNYLSFWDRFEKANSFYENIISTIDLPSNDRRVQAILQMPDDDGGQWDNAAALIHKYGLVPKYAMPETQPSNHTDEFSSLLAKRLRKDACILRDNYQQHHSIDTLNHLKHDMLSTIYRLCVYAFGTPVETFDFTYRDKDNHYHCYEQLTPQTFYQRFVHRNLEDYIVLCNAPDRPFYQTYTLPDETNIQGGQAVQFLNIPLEDMKQCLIQQLKDGKTTWFGCDVSQQMNRQKGLLSSQLYLYDDVFQTNLTFNKKERLTYYEAVCSHAMTFTGVDLHHEKATQWKVENSWGDKVGDNGYFVMDDEWFNEYVYEVVIDKRYLTPKMIEALTKEPHRLELWDALA